MARVSTHVKSPRATKQDYVCEARTCAVAASRDGDRTIRPGDRYYLWQPRNHGKRHQHVECGYPRPTQLSSAKTAAVDEAAEDAAAAIGEFSPDIPWNDVQPGGSLEVPTDDLKTALEQAAEAAREVGQEYSDSADAMPESLQYGTQAEAMREVGQELDSWADNLDGWSPSADDTLYVPDEYDPDEDAAREKLAADWEELVEALRGDAQDHLEAEPVPGYQG